MRFNKYTPSPVKEVKKVLFGVERVVFENGEITVKFTGGASG